MQNQRAKLNWRDGQTPVSEQFDDPYFSIKDGLAETQHVFLGGNDLPARFKDGFQIAELGFGTGLNLLTAWAAWQEAGATGTLRFTSFEAFPMAREEMQRALEAFPAITPQADAFFDAWDGGSDCAVEGLDFHLEIGDARETLPNWNGQADAWFLDGFSPAKNPELWEESLMAEVYQHTASGGTAATYTAAGFVRRGLTDAGFSVERIKGFAHKRHMTRATKS